MDLFYFILFIRFFRSLARRGHWTQSLAHYYPTSVIFTSSFSQQSGVFSAYSVRVSLFYFIFHRCFIGSFSIWELNIDIQSEKVANKYRIDGGIKELARFGLRCLSAYDSFFCIARTICRCIAICVCKNDRDANSNTYTIRSVAGVHWSLKWRIVTTFISMSTHLDTTVFSSFLINKVRAECGNGIFSLQENALLHHYKSIWFFVCAKTAFANESVVAIKENDSLLAV